jgi:hypothetical protein
VSPQVDADERDSRSVDGLLLRQRIYHAAEIATALVGKLASERGHYPVSSPARIDASSEFVLGAAAVEGEVHFSDRPALAREVCGEGRWILGLVGFGRVGEHDERERAVGG